jgi:hypothetical protein
VKLPLLTFAGAEADAASKTASAAVATIASKNNRLIWSSSREGFAQPD